MEMELNSDTFDLYFNITTIGSKDQYSNKVRRKYFSDLRKRVFLTNAVFVTKVQYS